MILQKAFNGFYLKLSIFVVNVKKRRLWKQLQAT